MINRHVAYPKRSGHRRPQTVCYVKTIQSHPRIAKFTCTSCLGAELGYGTSKPGYVGFERERAMWLDPQRVQAEGCGQRDG